MTTQPSSAAELATPAAAVKPSACSGCGLLVPGGVDGCQALFDDESVREYGDIRFAGRRRLVVDAYALQHPERYCASATSLAAHLTGLCIAIEHRPREEAINDAVQRWLSRRPQLDKPALPPTHGPLTIADVLAASDPMSHRAVVERWARGIWTAYAGLHPIARAWVKQVDR
jgi:putative intracellular protease/amidase